MLQYELFIVFGICIKRSLIFFVLSSKVFDLIIIVSLKIQVEEVLLSTTLELVFLWSFTPF